MKNDLLNDLRIASPCSVPWENMSGTERVRHCGQCDLRVYDISQLTRSQALDLITNNEGRLCLRLHRRLDGTVITRDCPVGLRALRQRVARRAGAVFATVLGLSSTLFAQIGSQSLSPVAREPATIPNAQNLEKRSVITGTVTDKVGGRLPRTAVELVDETGCVRSVTVTDDIGEFRFSNVRPGRYSLHIENPYFKKLVITEIILQDDQTVRLTSVLEVKTEIVGVMEFAPKLLSTETNQLSDYLILKKPQ
jgi:hypothetical protein